MNIRWERRENGKLFLQTRISSLHDEWEDVPVVDKYEEDKLTNIVETIKETALYECPCNEDIIELYKSLKDYFEG